MRARITGDSPGLRLLPNLSSQEIRVFDMLYAQRRHYVPSEQLAVAIGHPGGLRLVSNHVRNMHVKLRGTRWAIVHIRYTGYCLVEDVSNMGELDYDA